MDATYYYNIDTLENINNKKPVMFEYKIAFNLLITIKKTLIDNVFFINDVLCDFNKNDIIVHYDEEGNIIQEYFWFQLDEDTKTTIQYVTTTSIENG